MTGCPRVLAAGVTGSTQGMLVMVIFQAVGRLVLLQKQPVRMYGFRAYFLFILTSSAGRDRTICKSNKLPLDLIFFFFNQKIQQQIRFTSTCILLTDVFSY